MTASLQSRQRDDAARKAGRIRARLAAQGFKAQNGKRLLIEGGDIYEVSSRRRRAGLGGSLKAQLRGKQFLASGADMDGFAGFVAVASFSLPELPAEVDTEEAPASVLALTAAVLQASAPLPSQALRQSPRRPGAPSAAGR